MSTRHARVADKELNDKHTKILIELLQQPENRICADCKKKDPRWASWNLGIFVCIRCSGTHRSLGTHISKVKSVDLDTWTPEQIENMIEWGNKRANIYWEANLNGRQPSDYNMDVWIRAKYEQKKWVEKSEVDVLSETTMSNDRNKSNDDTIITQESDKKSNSESIPKDNLSREFGVNYQDPVANHAGRKETVPVKKSSPVLTPPAIHLDEKSKTNENVTKYKSTPPKVATTSSGFRIDMSSFQEQLSGLSIGRPSSGLIPQAPPGSNTSWTNFLVNQSSKSSSILDEPSTEKPLIPYDAFASLRR